MGKETLLTPTQHKEIVEKFGSELDSYEHTVIYKRMQEYHLLTYNNFIACKNLSEQEFLYGEVKFTLRMSDDLKFFYRSPYVGILA